MNTPQQIVGKFLPPGSCSHQSLILGGTYEMELQNGIRLGRGGNIKKPSKAEFGIAQMRDRLAGFTTSAPSAALAPHTPGKACGKLLNIPSSSVASANSASVLPGSLSILMSALS
jgi:hypothetical protein